MVATKFVPFFFLAVTLAMAQGGKIPNELKDLANVLHAMCTTETGASEEYIENARKGEFLDDPKAKCYFKCQLEKLGLINTAGVIAFDAMATLLPESLREVGLKMIENCRDTTGTDACDVAFNVHKCFYKVAPKEYVLI